MKKWAAAGVVVGLCAISILGRFNRSSMLLEDTDTKAILSGIEARHAPLSWFATDWPLENHFYRPISTLTFEIDRAISGSNAAGFGFSNALLVALSVIALAWLVREITDSVFQTCAAAFLLTWWCFDRAAPLPSLAWAMAALSLIGVLIKEHDKKSAVLGALLWVLVAKELSGLAYLSYRMIDWLPGRTASTMAVFALSAMALLARYLRLSCTLARQPEPSPLDPPATKNTQIGVAGAVKGMRLLFGAALLGWLALSSYEQAIMLLPIGIVLVWCFKQRGFGVPRFHFWTFLVPTVIYIAVRLATVPSGVSRYQDQQFRASASVFYSLADVAVPGFSSAALFLPNVVELPQLLLTVEPFFHLLELAAAITMIFHLSKKRPVLVFGWAASFLAFAPMAFLKHFDHYWFWPMAFRSLFVIVLAGLAFDLSVSGWRRPTRQAPKRLDPAPGSLPRL